MASIKLSFFQEKILVFCHHHEARVPPNWMWLGHNLDSGDVDFHLKLVLDVRGFDLGLL